MGPWTAWDTRVPGHELETDTGERYAVGHRATAVSDELAANRPCSPCLRETKARIAWGQDSPSNRAGGFHVLVARVG